MPDFVCKSCGSTFSIPQRSIDNYPGWKPARCRKCGPAKGSFSRRGGGGRRGGGRGKLGAAEENLTLDQVLAKYTDGPTSGIFTDGGCSPNPGPGGWGLVHVENGEIVRQDHGHEDSTTNNQMELQALIEAYRGLGEDAQVTVHTDSKLCVDTITKWAAGWERRGWRRKGGEIKNLERVQELYRLAQARPACRLQWIAAHSGNRWNEYADSLASAWRRSEL